MRPVSTFLLACLAACVALGAAAKHLGGADRQLDPYSPFMRALKEGPLPADWRGIAVLAHVMSYAHDDQAANGLMRYIERGALLEILGEPAPAPAARVEDALQEMSRTEKSVLALRSRVLSKPPGVELIQEHDPALAPNMEGGAFRHEGGSVWTHGGGGTQRVIGVRVVNRGAHEIVGAVLEFQIGPPAKVLRFSCRFGDSIAAGASRAMLCYGDRAKPVAEVLAAIRAAAGEVLTPMGLYEIDYRLRDSRLEVRSSGSHFIGEDRYIEQAARAMVLDQSCGARRACGAAIGEKLENPVLAGFALGVATGAIVLLVLWIWGHHAAGTAGASIVLILFALSVAFVIAVAVITSGAHILLVLLLAGAAMGYAGEVMVGFVMGIVAWSFLVHGITRLRHRLRSG